MTISPATPRTHQPPSATVPETMPAVVARRYGGPEVLQLEEVPTPVPGPDGVLVRVDASSLNPLDWHLLTGTPYLVRPTSGLRRPKHQIRGADVAGTVVAVGSGVTDLGAGDAVFGDCQHGALAAYVAVPADLLVARPAAVSVEAAAATPVAGLTALQALRTHGRVQPGDRVLVNGGAGGVGTFAVQIAVALGAEVIAVCSTRNIELVRSLGAAEVVDYLHEDFVDSGARFDVMVDNVGNRTAEECRRVLRPGGRYVAVSGPKDNRWVGPLPKLVRSAIGFRRTSQTFHQFIAAPNQDDLAYLGELLAAGKVVPAIDRVVTFDGVAAALEEISGGHTRAKIVVVPQG